MAVRQSRIHAELGFTPAELTFDMIVNAVEQRVAETEDLDWKQALPVADVDRSSPRTSPRWPTPAVA